MIEKIFSCLKIPVPKKEYKFCLERKWRIDYAFTDVKLAIEIEGGVWNNGRHNRSKGFLKDIEKYNKLTELGWSLLRYQPSEIDFDQIIRVYNSKKTCTKEE